MKRILCFFILICLVCSLAACGGLSDVDQTLDIAEAKIVQVKTVHTVAPETTELPTETSPEPVSSEPAVTEPPETTTEPVTTPEETTEPEPEGLLGFVWEEEKLYYYAQLNERFTGWLLTDEGYSYFNEERLEGLQTIDGQLYYFPDGILAFGHQTVEGRNYYFDKTRGYAVSLGWVQDGSYRRYLGEDGFLTGTHVIDGVTCVFDSRGVLLQDIVDGILYDQGKKLIGYVEYNGAYYYTNGEGRIQTGLQNINHNWYYFLPDGKNAVGFVRDPSSGECYYANETGWLDSGFNEVDGKVYYFDPNNTHAMLRNTTVGIYNIDENGVCHSRFGEITNDNLDAYLEQILSTYGRSPRSIFDYVVNNYAYKRMAWEDTRVMAIKMLNTGYGACYHFCAVTSMLLQKAGYSSLWVIGELHHYWLLVEMSPGVWRHMDTMRKHFGIYNLTDAQMDALDGTYGVNFKWDHTQWTSTTTTGRGDGPKASDVPETTPEPTTEEPTTEAPTTEAPTTAAPTTEAPTTEVPATAAPTTPVPTTEAPTTAAPETTAQPPETSPLPTEPATTTEEETTTAEETTTTTEEETTATEEETTTAEEITTTTEEETTTTEEETAAASSETDAPPAGSDSSSDTTAEDSAPAAD